MDKIISFTVIIMYKKPINNPYVTIHAVGGLNNKLRVLLSYLHEYNQGKYPNKKLRIIWTKGNDCPDIFLNLFEPLENIHFVYDKNSIYLPYIEKTTTEAVNNNYIQKKYYKMLQPVQNIQNIIDIVQNQLGNEYIACHIRRTDMIELYTKYKIKYCEDDEYIDFINSHSKNLKIYIATDNKVTQNKFIKLYPNRIIYKKIEQIKNLRQTSLQDAVKDMYVCAGAKYFMGSISSFTDTIMHLRQ